jgi:AraC family transcriptional regulator, transcriptional activator of pobA
MEEKRKDIKPFYLKDIDVNKFPINKEDLFIIDNILISKNVNIALMNNFIEKSQAYRIGEYRILKLMNGSINVTANLIPRSFKKDDIIFAPKGTLIEINNVSDNAKIVAIGFPEDAITDLNLNNLDFLIIHLKEKECQYNNAIFDILWQSTKKEYFFDKTTLFLLKAYISNVFNLIQLNWKTETKKSISHSEQVFKNFLKLVNQYAITERDTKFYADKLFLSPHYLAKIIKDRSGQTIKDWINKQVILEAKILLKHSNKLIFEISDELNFANASFFSKFFKHITGITPKEYKNS